MGTKKQLVTEQVTFLLTLWRIPSAWLRSSRSVLAQIRCGKGGTCGKTGKKITEQCSKPLSVDDESTVMGCYNIQQMGDYHNPIWYFLFTKRNFIEWWRLWRLPYPPRQRVLAMNRNDVFGLRFLEYFPKWCLSIAKQTISHQLVVFSSSSWIPKLSFCDCMEIVCVRTVF